MYLPLHAWLPPWLSKRVTKFSVLLCNFSYYRWLNVRLAPVQHLLSARSAETEQELFYDDYCMKGRSFAHCGGRDPPSHLRRTNLADCAIERFFAGTVFAPRKNFIVLYKKKESLWSLIFTASDQSVKKNVPGQSLTFPWTLRSLPYPPTPHSTLFL